jgi:hypothetical protein
MGKALGVVEITTELGKILRPMHPGCADPTLASYFVIEVADEVDAEDVIARLLECDAVEGAYVKPPEDLP